MRDAGGLTAVRLTVKVPVVGPVSVAVESDAVMVTVGRSLSAMVTVAVLADPTM